MLVGLFVFNRRRRLVPPPLALLFKAAGENVNGGFKEQNGNQCVGNARVVVGDAERRSGCRVSRSSQQSNLVLRLSPGEEEEEWGVGGVWGRGGGAAAALIFSLFFSFRFFSPSRR